MEDLPAGFNVEKSTDDDEETVRPKKPAKILDKIFETKAEKPKDKEAQKESLTPLFTKERLVEAAEDKEADVDTAPELDAEAPLEHLSGPETEAIAQTLASERLDEIRSEATEGIDNETLAAESFLENVEASRDIGQAYNETLQELGEAAIELPEPAIIETETALPVDPRTLKEAAQDELRPNVSYHIDRQPSQPTPERAAESRRRPGASSAKHPEKTTAASIVDYVVGRRLGRLKEARRQDVIEHKLSQEVDQIKLQLTSRESHLRELAKNKTIEKKPRPIRDNLMPEALGAVAAASKQEAIGTIDQALVDDEPAKGTSRELAGIRAHTMEYQRLMDVAQGIKVEGQPNLKQLYESHLVGEKGLRRIVAEYLRGGNYQKALRRELLERQRDFERDPKLRDQGSSLSLTATSANLDQLLERTGIDWSEPQPTLVPSKVKANNLPSLVANIRESSPKLRIVADVIMVVAILTLAVVTALLFINR